MDRYLHTINEHTIDTINRIDKQSAIHALESGKILYLPAYALTPHADEHPLLSESVLDKKHKNISYDYQKTQLAGLIKTSPFTANMQQFMHRYAMFARQLVDTVLPQYSTDIRWGRTSYRPAQINGRQSSKRQDDTRVHVDAFPSTPVNGLRIFRVFCNINPYGEPRVWHIGEPFSQVLKTFSPQLPIYNKTKATLLHLVKATKTKRSAYDHYMLHMHDAMKLNNDYQQTLNKHRVDFPSKSTWLVFTDHVSHAALSGQFLLEQTFYLPIDAMKNPEYSPFKQWQSTGLV
ncbi:MAG: Kdo hydroxylase family protein [Legionellaceae bacterium]|nr:Kdo hydroxylase family protein [Legionellaceae bacterium]